MTPDEWKEAQRPGFEAWYKTTDYYAAHILARKALNPTEYKFLTAQCAWEGWLAAKAEPVEVTDEMVERAVSAQIEMARTDAPERKDWAKFFRVILSAALNPNPTKGSP